MADDYRLTKLSEAAAASMIDLRRRLAVGINADIALADALEELETATVELLTRPPGERPLFSIDWECAGMLMAEGLDAALTVYAHTPSKKAAAIAFNRRVRPLLRPRLAW